MIIRAMRIWAEQIPMPGRHRLLIEAADRLEELDERVAIMSEGRTGKWIDDGFCHSNLLGQMTNWKCSNCHASVMNKGIKPDFEYCPHCGARMEEENATEIS